MAPETDLYRVLEVSPKASAEELRASYRRLARRFHPDVNPDPDAGERMKQINAAYDVLGDIASRRQYDLVHAWRERSEDASWNSSRQSWDEPSAWRRSKRKRTRCGHTYEPIAQSYDGSYRTGLGTKVERCRKCGQERATRRRTGTNWVDVFWKHPDEFDWRTDAFWRPPADEEKPPVTVTREDALQKPREGLADKLPGWCGFIEGSLGGLVWLSAAIAAVVAVVNGELPVVSVVLWGGIFIIIGNYLGEWIGRIGASLIRGIENARDDL
jgi:DnaJ domain